ncbi:hypothetical protein [uncultured Helicobacter sp.]
MDCVSFLDSVRLDSESKFSKLDSKLSLDSVAFWYQCVGNTA